MNESFLLDLVIMFTQNKRVAHETYLTVISRSNSNERIDFDFYIHNFISSGSTKIESSNLIASHKCKSSWQIVLDPVASGYDYYYATIKVGLIRTDSNKCDVKASLFFEIQNSKRDVYVREAMIEKIYSSTNKTGIYSNILMIPSNSIYDTGMNGNKFRLDNNCLIIKGTILIQDCCPCPLKEKNITELQSNFKTSYQNNSFSDVVFSLGDDKMSANKMVLSARSPVFQKMFAKLEMFEQKMKDTHLNSIKITDIEISVFDVFLLFLYTGILENTEFDTVRSLYSTADKYEVTTLFETCRDILVSYISDKTAPVILKLADMHSDETLKQKAVHFICDNFTKIDGTDAWNNLLDTDPRLASYTLKMVSSSVLAVIKA